MIWQFLVVGIISFIAGAVIMAAAQTHYEKGAIKKGYIVLDGEGFHITKIIPKDN